MTPTEIVTNKCREFHARKYFQALRSVRPDMTREKAVDLMDLARGMCVTPELLNTHAELIQVWHCTGADKAGLLKTMRTDPVLRIFAEHIDAEAKREKAAAKLAKTGMSAREEAQLEIERRERMNRGLEVVQA